jgi:flagellin
MRINTNITAIVSNNSLQKAEGRLQQSIQRLSSGYKINSSADDPAGCAISEKMRLQLKGLGRATNNTADGISVLNTAEGALTEIQSMLSRMKELSVQAANDVNSDQERQAIQDEISSINSEIDRISNDTEFNTQSLINGNLSRRVYSDYSGVNQLECSDGFVAGNYGITITQDARQAIAVGDNKITMNDSQSITESQQGSITINGYQVQINAGDTLNAIMNKLVDAADKTGGKAFTIVPDAANDTKINGNTYAGYIPETSYQGNKLVIMSNEYGSNQSLNITCNNTELANMLGISSATSQLGWNAEGSDVRADFTTQTKDGETSRVGFANSAVITTKGTVVTVKDVNNKTFQMDVPGNTAGTKFNDEQKVNGKSKATSTDKTDIVQEVTDVGTMSIHIGANEYQVIKLDIPAVTTYTLGTDRLNVMTTVNASNGIDIVDNAITRANAVRSKIGAYENRFDHTTSNLSTSTENLTSALSTMVDTDMAEEMTEYTSMNVLTQAATSILSQANQRPSTVLQLLQ